MWSKGKTFDDAIVIREQEGGLYKLKGQPDQALVYDTVEPNELWIEVLHMCITESYHLQAKLLKVFQKYRQSMKEFAKDVQRENESWKSSTQMFAVWSHPIH